jgi:predicted nuclease with TOPRIM domain
MQIQIDPVKAAWPRLLADSMKDINHRTYRHIDQVRGLTEQTQIASREIRSSFGDSEKAIRDLIEEQKATKKQLAETQKQLSETIEASAKQAAALEEKLDKMQTILTKLTRRLDTQTTEFTASETVRAQLSLAQQETKLLKQQKVGRPADPGKS